MTEKPPIPMEISIGERSIVWGIGPVKKEGRSWKACAGSVLIGFRPLSIMGFEAFARLSIKGRRPPL
jgi:hypothetical protein